MSGGSAGNAIDMVGERGRAEAALRAAAINAYWARRGFDACARPEQLRIVGADGRVALGWVVATDTRNGMPWRRLSASGVGVRACG